MNNQDNKPAQNGKPNTLLTLLETLTLDWQRIVDVSQNDKTYAGLVFQKFIQMVESHHRKQCSSKFYAEKLNMNSSNLRKICNEAIGFAPSYCMHARQMLEACKLLNGPHKAIMEIASELGFADPKHFSKFFKRYGGASPDSYRKFIHKSQ